MLKKIFSLESVAIVTTCCLLLTGCSSSSPSTQVTSTTEPQPMVKEDSTIKVDTPVPFAPTTQTKTQSFSITKLKLSDGMILKIAVVDKSEKKIAESQVLTFSPDLASVTANGDAFLEFKFDETDAKTIGTLAKTPGQKLMKVLYDISVDSQGRTSDKELARQAL